MNLYQLHSIVVPVLIKKERQIITSMFNKLLFRQQFSNRKQQVLCVSFVDPSRLLSYTLFSQKITIYNTYYKPCV